ncbi:unnamed protein product [Blepharisma stoltei]|uniref:Uncharacterized protein n=1 Tax=Blepharisma stoltei TaxID=1481888 RepID=A0AAU9IRT6_9CILI|nr:unnamed protein product [Blepharisma stoltei]
MGCTANIKGHNCSGDEETSEEKNNNPPDLPKADLSLSLPANGKSFKIRVYGPTTNGLINEPTVETING